MLTQSGPGLQRWVRYQASGEGSVIEGGSESWWFSAHDPADWHCSNSRFGKSVVPLVYSRVVQLRYRYRIYPPAPQRRKLARVFGCVRTVWNDAVAVRKRAHAEDLPYPRTTDLDKALITAAKRTSERAWLSEVSPVPLQQALRDCHAAYRAFFDSLSGKRAGARVGPPRFKKRTGMQSARYTRNARFAFTSNGRLRLPKVGELKVAWSRDLPAEPSSVTVIKTPTGKYYASFVVSIDGDAERLEPMADPEAETGIDLGLKDFAVLRGGKRIENPKFFARLERK
ncbi:RNA-guided endonuclease InsQ/TnpB family protein, partial [Glycomyces buryatensis]